MAASSPHDLTFTINEAEGYARTHSGALDAEVFSVPVTTLIDLWVQKYGHAWVDVSEVLQDPFYSLAYARLKSLGAVEVHYLTDRAKFVCRKPE